MKGPLVRTFAVINQKGGCGKTTTSINLAAAFAELDCKTLLVDVDPQGHCALGLAVPETQLDFSIADALLADLRGGFDLNDVIWQISSKLDLAPSTVNLAGAEHRLADASDRDLRLKKVLAYAESDYDICIIDCPPNIGLLTFNALRAAGEVIIPVETGYFSLAGAVKQATTLQVLADRVGHQVCLHVLPTMYDVRTKMAREIVNELKKHFGTRVLEVPIHFNAKLKEAASFGQPISEYDPASRGSQDFERLARHLLAIKPVPQPLGAAAPTSSAQPVNPVVSNLVEAACRGRAHVHESSESDDLAPVAVAAPPTNNRATELVQRARALAERTAELQQRLAADPDVARIESRRQAEQQPIDDPDAQRSLQQKLSTLYGVKTTQQGTLFIQPDSPDTNAQSICVAGDFNDWQAESCPLMRDQRLGVWQRCVPLPPGRYRYRLVVDGKWIRDPHNRAVEVNPFGEFDNVFEVAEV